MWNNQRQTGGLKTFSIMIYGKVERERGTTTKKITKMPEKW
jgi:hypothetical protein